MPRFSRVADRRDLEFSAQVAVGQSFQIDVSVPEAAAVAGDLGVLEAAFQERERLYGHGDTEAPIYMTELRVRIRGGMPMPVQDLMPSTLIPVTSGAAGGAVRGGVQQSYWGDGAKVATQGLVRSTLNAEGPAQGPAIIDLDDSTILVPPGYSATSEASGAVIFSSGDR